MSAKVSYTSPSGKKFSFHYDDGLSGETDLKTATFTFPGKDGAYIQQLGRDGRRWSLSCAFYGPDCAKTADDLEKALCESGYGELELPNGARHRVTPTGTIRKNVNNTRGANVASVETTFAETITGGGPSSATLSNDRIASSADSFAQAAPQEFADALTIENGADLSEVKSTMTKQAQTAGDSLEKMAASSPDTYADFSAVKTSWLENIKNFANSIENYTKNALTIAGQAITLMRYPSQVAISVLAKVEGYASIADSLIKNFLKIRPPFRPAPKSRGCRSRPCGACSSQSSRLPNAPPSCAPCRSRGTSAPSSRTCA